MDVNRLLRIFGVAMASLAITACSDCDNDISDIAILKLDITDLNPSKQKLLKSIKPIPLATASEWAKGDSTQIVGYGLTKAVALDQPIKRDGPVHVQDCQDSQNGEFICFSVTESGLAVCGGDSGGPMMRQVGGEQKLIGVASRSEYSCAAGDGIYVDVTRSDYREWIQSKISTYNAPTDYRFVDLTPSGAGNGELTASNAVDINNFLVNTTTANSGISHITTTLNFPKEKIESGVLLTRDFMSGLYNNTRGSPMTVSPCINNPLFNMIGLCSQEPVDVNHWMATVSSEDAVPGFYQISITGLQAIP